MMANRFVLLLAAGALLLFTTIAYAATPAGAEYVLGPEDVIEIVVKNHDTLSKITPITRDGTILITDIGEVKAAGITARQLAANIQTELEKTLNNVAVNVIVKEIHTTKLFVRVVGGARATGFLEMQPSWRIMDLIASSGGLSAKPAFVNGMLQRGTALMTLNLKEAFAHPEGPANVPLEPDDLVIFSEKEKPAPVVVVGQVERPGSYDLEDTTTLTSLLTQAGGLSVKAAPNKAWILRDGQQIPIDLMGIASGISSTAALPDFRLKPKDVLFVPENLLHYSVQGDVRQTGQFPYPVTGKVTVLQVYTQAGGSAHGELKNAGIIRFVQGRYTKVPVNIAQLLNKKNTNFVDPPLEPGDTLYVPEKGARGGFDWTNILTPLSALSLLGLRFGR